MMVQSRSLPVTRASWRSLSASSARSRRAKMRPNRNPEWPRASPTPWLEIQISRLTYPGGIHRGDDVSGAGMQVVASRGGPGLPERADHRVVAGNGCRNRTGVEHVAGHLAQAGMAA